MLDSWGTFLHGLGEVAGGIVVIAGAIRGVPWVGRMFNSLRTKHALVLERDIALGARDAAMSEATTTRRLIGDMRDALNAVRSEFSLLKDRVTHLESQLSAEQSRLSVAMRYIRALIEHITSGGNAAQMPPIPPELADDL